MTILLFNILMGSYAQNTNQPRIDSLLKITERGNPTAKTQALNSLAEAYYNLDIKKSLYYGEEALELAQLSNDVKGIQSAYKILRRVHRRLGNYTVAIEYTLQNLPLAEQQKDTAELLDAYTTLGNIHSSMNNFTESQQYLKQAKIIGEKINAPTLANILNYIGRGYGKSGEYDSAVFYIRAAMLRELEYPQPGYGLSYIYNNLAEVYIELEKYEEALHYYDLAMSLDKARQSPLGKTFSLNGLARVYQKKKVFDKAINYALESIDIAQKNLYRDKAREAYGTLYEIYQDKGDYKKALDYYRQYNLYKDSIFSDDKVQYIENLKINYETERIKQENELLRKDAELKDAQLRQQYTTGAVFAIVILFLVTASVLIYRNNRQRKKTNILLRQYNDDLELQVSERTKELTTTNAELIKQNTQLEQFGYITAHNLRAPVARVLGLASIFGNSDFTSSPQDQEVLERIRFEIEGLDTIIRDLNSILDIKKGVHHSYEKVNIKERLEKVKRILKDKIEESGAQIIEDISADTLYALPAYIESILYNLMSNAIKYRHAERKVIITIKTFIANNELTLLFQDNGIGIDLSKFKTKIFTPYQRFHNHVEGKGLGLFLVKTQVEALNGFIEVNSIVNEGTTFKINLPAKQSIG